MTEESPTLLKGTQQIVPPDYVRSKCLVFSKKLPEIQRQKYDLKSQEKCQ